MRQGKWRLGAQVAYLALLLGALASCGCLVVAAGAVGGAAAMGYAYYKGELYTNYYTSLYNTHASTLAALADLRMPLVKDEGMTGGFYVESRTDTNERVRVYVTTQAGKTPAEGPVTRVGIRVGLFGDRAVSERLLDQVSSHVVHPPIAEGPPPPLASAPQSAIRPIAATGSPQPIAPPLPARQQSPPPLTKEPVPIQ